MFPPPTVQATTALPPARCYDSPAKGVEFIARHVGSTTIVALHPDQESSPSGFWLDSADFAAAAEWAAQQSEAGCNLYYTANEPAPGVNKKPRKTDIRRARCVYADVDAKDGRDMQQAFAAIGAVAVAPSFIIMSGGGYQPVWMLPEPIEATPDLIALAERIGKRIARAVGGDEVQNVDRILRLPFSRNYPNAKKRAEGRPTRLSGIVDLGAGS